VRYPLSYPAIPYSTRWLTCQAAPQRRHVCEPSPSTTKRPDAISVPIDSLGVWQLGQ